MTNKSIRRIAFSNQKGGPGKTTLSLQFTYHLVREGLKVLVVDFDPQGNASTRLSKDQNTPQQATLKTVDLFSEKEVDPNNILKCESGCDLIFSRKNDAELYAMNGQSLERMVYPAMHIDRLAQHYDIVIIDCPPTLGPNLLAALNAASHVVAPVEVSGFAIDALEGLFETFAEVQETTNHDLKIAGVVVNKFNSRSVDHAICLKQLREAVGDELIFDTKIAFRGKIDSANSRGVPIHTLKDRKATSEFRSVFTEILQACEV